MKAAPLLTAVAGALATVWLQGMWPPALRLHGQWPDLSLVFALLVGLFHGAEAGLVAGCAVGLAMGYGAGLAMPLFLVSRALVGAATDVFGLRFHNDNLLVQSTAVFVGTLACEAIFAVGCPSLLGPDWLSCVLARAGLNVAVAPVLAMIVRRLRLRPDGETA